MTFSHFYTNTKYQKCNFHTVKITNNSNITSYITCSVKDMKKACSETKEYVKNGKFNVFLRSIVRQDITKNVITLVLHSEYIKKNPQSWNKFYTQSLNVICINIQNENKNGQRFIKTKSEHFLENLKLKTFLCEW